MITIQVKENSKQAKKMLEYLRTLPFVEFLGASGESHHNKKFVEKINRGERNEKGKDLPISKNVPNAETLRIFKRNEKAKGTRNKSAADMYKKLGI